MIDYLAPDVARTRPALTPAAVVLCPFAYLLGWYIGWVGLAPLVLRG